MSPPIKSCRECRYSGEPDAVWSCPSAASDWIAEANAAEAAQYDWPSQDSPCPGYEPRITLRAAFNAGYRMGYGNGYVDAEEGDERNDDPGDGYELWMDDNDSTEVEA